MTVELQSGNRFPHVVTRQCNGVFRLLDPPIQGHPRDSMRTLMRHCHMHVGNTLLGTNSDVKLDMFQGNGPNAIRSGRIRHRDRAIDEFRLPDHECPCHQCHGVLVGICLPVYPIQDVPPTPFIATKGQPGLLNQESFADNLFFQKRQESKDQIDALCREHHLRRLRVMNDDF